MDHVAEVWSHGLVHLNCQEQADDSESDNVWRYRLVLPYELGQITIGNIHCLVYCQLLIALDGRYFFNEKHHGSTCATRVHFRELIARLPEVIAGFCLLFQHSEVRSLRVFRSVLQIQPTLAQSDLINGRQNVNLFLRPASYHQTGVLSIG